MMNRRMLIIALAALGVAAAALVVMKPWASDDTDLLALYAAARGLEAQADESSGEDPDTLTSEQLIEALRDTNWQVRLASAGDLRERNDVPVERRARAMLDALFREVASPGSAPPITGSYLSSSAMTKLHLAQIMGDLGSGAVPAMKDAAAKSSGEARDWTTVALGYAGQREVAPKLREILRTSSQAELRMAAAHLLGLLGDRDAIPDLTRALEDPYTATIGRSDRVGLPPPRPFFPVREQATGALEALGVNVERRGDSFRVIR